MKQLCTKSIIQKNMNTIIIKQEQYDELLSKIESIQVSLDIKGKNPEEIVLDNQEFIQLLKIIKRTSQTWRDEGKIAFSQIGSKIYYKMSDVQKLLDTHFRKAFSKVRSNF